MTIKGREWVVNLKKLSRIGFVNKVSGEQRLADIWGMSASGRTVNTVALEQGKYSLEEKQQEIHLGK